MSCPSKTLIRACSAALVDEPLTRKASINPNRAAMTDRIVALTSALLVDR